MPSAVRMSCASAGKTLKRTEKKCSAERRLCGVVSASLDRMTGVKSCARFSLIRSAREEAPFVLNVGAVAEEERDARVSNAVLRACFSLDAAETPFPDDDGALSDVVLS